MNHHVSLCSFNTLYFLHQKSFYNCYEIIPSQVLDLRLRVNGKDGQELCLLYLLPCRVLLGSQVGLELTIYPRVGSNSGSSCLIAPSAEITDVYYHA
jgi:hypothetical protein